MGFSYSLPEAFRSFMTIPEVRFAKGKQNAWIVQVSFLLSNFWHQNHRMEVRFKILHTFNFTPLDLSHLIDGKSGSNLEAMALLEQENDYPP